MSNSGTVVPADCVPKGKYAQYPGYDTWCANPAINVYRQDVCGPGVVITLAAVVITLATAVITLAATSIEYTKNLINQLLFPN